MSKEPNYGEYVPVLLDPIADAKPVEVPLKKECETKNENTEERLRIVAPMAMGEGSKLYVEFNGSTYIVKIPQGGVESGETFVANGHRKTPIVGGWRDGLFECFQPMEGSFTAAAWCVHPVAFASLMEPLKMDCFFRRNTSIPHGVVFGFMCVLWLFVAFLSVNQQMATQASQTYTYHSSHSSGGHAAYNYQRNTTEPIVPPIFTGMLSWYLIALMVAVRLFTRMKYKIPGSCCIDCLSVYFCSCCSALQIFRHMKASGDEPKWTRMDHHTKAELVEDEECVLQAKASIIDEETDAETVPFKKDEASARD